MAVDYKLTLLARAEKAGTPVHEGLRGTCPCLDERGDRQSRDTCGECANNIHVAFSNAHRTGRPVTIYNVHTSNCERCNGINFIPNPDPMALIAACQAQGWDVGFYPNPTSEDGPYVEVIAWETVQCQFVSWNPDNTTALTDVLFQATKTLEPDNWTGCLNGNEHIIAETGATCPDCSGTGIVIKGAASVN